MFKNLSFGTKIASVVSLVVITIMFIVVIIVSIQAREKFSTETEKILKTNAVRYSNFIHSVFSQGLVSVLTTRESLQSFFETSSTYTEYQLIDDVDSMVASNPWLVYGFLYVKDVKVELENNSRSRLGEGNEFIFATKQKGKDAGGFVQQIPATRVFTETQAFRDAMKFNYSDKHRISFGNPINMNIYDGEIFGVSIIAPLYDKDRELIGVIGGIIDLSRLREELVSRDKIFRTEIRMLISDNDIIVSHSNKKAVNQSFTTYNATEEAKTIIAAVRSKNNGIYPYYSMTNQTRSLAAVYNFDIPGVPDRHWALVNNVAEYEIAEPVNGLVYSICCVILVGVVFIIFVCIIFVRYQIVNRINNITKLLSSFFRLLRHEDINMRTIKVRYNDELGKMVHAINENIIYIQDGLQKDELAVREFIDVAKDIKRGNFTTRITHVPHNVQLVQLREVLNEMLDSLQAQIGGNMDNINKVFDSYKSLDFSGFVENAKGNVELNTNSLGREIASMLRSSEGFANQLSQKSKMLDDSMADLIASSNTQASSLQESAIAIEQISASMKNISSRTVELTNQTEEIRGVIEIIRDIAEQTNLLALNAAIEATRAGEHGRGFAVVADEVRKLAERTQGSLSDIESNANALIQTSNDMVESIREQTSGIEQINVSVSQLEEITQSNVFIANKTCDITKEVANIAQEILDDVMKKRY